MHEARVAAALGKVLVEQHAGQQAQAGLHLDAAAEQTAPAVAVHEHHLGHGRRAGAGTGDDEAGFSLIFLFEDGQELGTEQEIGDALLVAAAHEHQGGATQALQRGRVVGGVVFVHLQVAHVGAAALMPGVGVGGGGAGGLAAGGRGEHLNGRIAVGQQVGEQGQERVVVAATEYHEGTQGRGGSSSSRKHKRGVGAARWDRGRDLGA